MLLRDLRDGQALAARLRSCLGDVSEMDLCSTLAMCDVRVYVGSSWVRQRATRLPATISPSQSDAIQLRARAPTRDVPARRTYRHRLRRPARAVRLLRRRRRRHRRRCRPSRVAGRPGPQHALAMALSAELLAGGAAALRKGESDPKRPAGAQEGGFAVSLDALRSVKLKSAAARPAAAPPAEPADSELITAMRAKLKRVKSPVMELELSARRRPLSAARRSSSWRRRRRRAAPAGADAADAAASAARAGASSASGARRRRPSRARHSPRRAPRENTPHGGGARGGGRRPRSARRSRRAAAGAHAAVSNALASPLASPLSIRARSAPARRRLAGRRLINSG